jgi:hypothetical protein
VLFTDIEMGGPDDGITLAQYTHKAHPSTGLLIASGRVCPAPNVLPPKSIFLPKSYGPGRVASALRELLAA